MSEIEVFERVARDLHSRVKFTPAGFEGPMQSSLQVSDTLTGQVDVMVRSQHGRALTGTLYPAEIEALHAILTAYLGK